MSKIFSDKYILKYQKDCLKLLWYERDMMTYFDHLKCKEMRDDPDSYSKNVKVANFDIIHHECHSDKLKGTYKEYNTIKNEHWSKYPKEEAKAVLLATFRIKRDDF